MQINGKEKCQRPKHVYCCKGRFGVSKKKIRSSIITSVIIIVTKQRSKPAQRFPFLAATFTESERAKQIQVRLTNWQKSQTDSGEQKQLPKEELVFELELNPDIIILCTNIMIKRLMIIMVRSSSLVVPPPGSTPPPSPGSRLALPLAS